MSGALAEIAIVIVAVVGAGAFVAYRAMKTLRGKAACSCDDGEPASRGSPPRVACSSCADCPGCSSFHQNEARNG